MNDRIILASFMVVALAGCADSASIQGTSSPKDAAVSGTVEDVASETVITNGSATITLPANSLDKAFAGSSIKLQSIDKSSLDNDEIVMVTGNRVELVDLNGEALPESTLLSDLSYRGTISQGIWDSLSTDQRKNLFVILKAGDKQINVPLLAISPGEDFLVKIPAALANAKGGVEVLVVYGKVSKTVESSPPSGSDTVSNGTGSTTIEPGVNAVPTHAPVSISFTDSDADGGEVAGTIIINKANDESSLSHYIIYWGSSVNDKLTGSEAIAEIPKSGSSLSYTFSAETVIPSGATHFLVYAKNSLGEATTPAYTLIVDSGVPTSGPTSLVFTDSDTSGGQIQGVVTITKAADESDISHYMLYWGTNATTKSGTAIDEIAATGANVSHNCAADTDIPDGVTHMLAFSKNADGEMATGAYLAIVDVGPPTALPGAISFSDGDYDGGQISGTLTFNNAIDESEISHYALYWGSNPTSKQSGSVIQEFSKADSLSYNFTADTPIPSGPIATHFLVYSKNANGEGFTPKALAIDDSGLPTNMAAGVSFTDSDSTGGEISGEVTITKASSEADITHYVLYWGTDATTKRASTAAINEFAVTGSNLTHTFAADTSIPTEPAATHLLVFTKNVDGEMVNAVAVAIVDYGPPLNAATYLSFTDEDSTPNEISGTLTIEKAAEESDITHYVLYWGTDATTKRASTAAITEIAATGSNVTHAFGADTPVPTSPDATYFLVFSKNTSGEMSTPTALAISDSASTVLNLSASGNNTGHTHPQDSDNGPNYFTTSENPILFGEGSAGYHQPFILIENVAIPQGATINSATLTTTVATANAQTLTNCTVYISNYLTPSMPASFGDALTMLGETSASIGCANIESVTIGTSIAIDVGSLIQTQIDNGSWSSNNAILLIINNDPGSLNVVKSLNDSFDLTVNFSP